jgi:hypothetical protein
MSEVMNCFRNKYFYADPCRPGLTAGKIVKHFAECTAMLLLGLLPCDPFSSCDVAAAAAAARCSPATHWVGWRKARIPAQPLVQQVEACLVQSSLLLQQQQHNHAQVCSPKWPTKHAVQSTHRLLRTGCCCCLVQLHLLLQQQLIARHYVVVTT